MVKKVKPDLVFMEDHHHALDEWRKRHFKKCTLLHFDPHIDYQKTSVEDVNIANFLYLALNERIVSEIYWVIPGTNDQLLKDILYLKKMLPPNPNLIHYNRNMMHVLLYSVHLYVTTIENLPLFTKPILLDVDVDFFVTKRLKQADPLVEIGTRTPWIRPKKLASLIRERVKYTLFTTIAYSVNGGYTPLCYKSLGDQFALSLGYDDESVRKRITAGQYFSKYITARNKNHMKSAKAFYMYAVALNPTYLVPDNTYGMLYLRTKNIIKAQNEFLMMLKVNKSDIYSLIGMGIVCLYRNNVTLSMQYFSKVLSIHNQNKTCLLYLALLALKHNHKNQALKFITSFQQLSDNAVISLYLQYRYCLASGQIRKSQKLFTQILETKKQIEVLPGLELL